MVRKGKVSAIFDGGNFVTVAPYGGGVVSVKLPVPMFLIGELPVGTPVVYVLFEDNTGIILSRMDGYGRYGGGDLLPKIAATSQGDSIVITDENNTGLISVYSEGDAIVVKDGSGRSAFVITEDDDSVIFKNNGG